MEIVLVNGQLKRMKYCRVTECTCTIFDIDLWPLAKGREQYTGYEPHK